MANSTKVESKKDYKPLTALAVKRHKYSEVRSECVLVDTHPHQGLRLVANKNGSKTWIYRYRKNTKQLGQIKLGEYPVMELADARRAFLEQKDIKQREGDPKEYAESQRSSAQEKKEKELKERFSLGVMVEEYLVEMVEKNRVAKSAADARTMMERFLGGLSDKSVKDVSAQQLHAHILAIASKTPDTARRFRAELKAAWNYSVSTGKTNIACPVNTQLGGKLTQGKRERFLNREELALLLPWMENYSAAVRDALMLTLYLGLRSGEVCGIREKEVTEEQDGFWLTIPAERMKKRRIHRVPLSGTALEIIQKRLNGGFLFPSRVGGHIKQKVLGVEVYTRSGKSGAKSSRGNLVCPVSDWAPNDLRKTARTMLASLKCPYEVAESIIAHKIPGVGGLYNQYDYDDEKRYWLLVLGGFLDGML